MTSLPTHGSVAEAPVPRLLLDLYRDRYSGALSLECQRMQKKILFHEGAPVAAESDLASDSLCAQLVSTGTLTRVEVSRVEDTVAQKGCEESVAVLELGLMQPRELFAALKELVKRRTIACFGWSEGNYTLSPEDKPAEHNQPFRADPIALVQEGLELAWDVDRMLQALTPQMDRFPVARSALAGAVQRLQTDATTDAMLSQLDGSSSLGDLLSAAVQSRRALAAAWVVDACGLLRYHDAAVGHSDDRLETKVEIEIAPLADEPQAERAATPQGAAPGSAGGDKATKNEAMKREILERVAQQADQDLYAVLGLERHASGAEIKKAYFSLAKRFHPDALARVGLESMKREATAIFSRTAEAYETLKDDQKRANYDDALDSGSPEIDTTSLAQAETFFRKGEILVKMGDFRGALQFLQNAVDLWPEEAAYQATLGWALYKKNPPDSERAKEHLELALPLAPKDAVVHFRLGVVLRALGETEAAEDSISRAKKLETSVVDAR